MENKTVKTIAIIPNRLKTNSLIFRVNKMYIPKNTNRKPMNRYMLFYPAVGLVIHHRINKKNKWGKNG